MVAAQARAQKASVGAGRGDDDFRRLTLFDPIHQWREHLELVGGGAVRALRQARHAKETRDEKRVTAIGSTQAFIPSRGVVAGINRALVL